MAWLRLSIVLLYATAVLQSYGACARGCAHHQTRRNPALAGQIAVLAILQIFLTALLNSDQNANTAVNLFMCAYLAVGVAAGLAADRLGEARGNYLMQAVGVLIWSGGSVDEISLWFGSSFIHSSLCLPLCLIARSATILVFPTTTLDVTTAVIGLAFTALGYGMLNPTQVVFVGSQCVDKADSERVIAYLYFAFNVGNLAGEFLSPVLRQQFDVGVALWASFGAVVGGAALFLVGTPTYRNASLFSVGCLRLSVWSVRSMIGMLSRARFCASAPPPTPTPTTSALRRASTANAKRCSTTASRSRRSFTRRHCRRRRRRSARGAARTRRVTLAAATRRQLSRWQVLLIAAPIPIFFAILYQTNSTIVDQAKLLVGLSPRRAASRRPAATRAERRRAGRRAAARHHGVVGRLFFVGWSSATTDAAGAC